MLPATPYAMRMTLKSAVEPGESRLSINNNNFTIFYLWSARCDVELEVSHVQCDFFELYFTLRDYLDTSDIGCSKLQSVYLKFEKRLDTLV